MEIKVQKQEFLKALSMVGNAAAQKANTLPILGNILLETQGTGHLKVVGTDLEIGISTVVPAEVIKEGSITVPAKKIMEIIRELSEGSIEIVVAKNNAVNIKAGKAYFKVMGLSKDDFPKIAEAKEEKGIEIEQASLKECLALTAFAISFDETRYVLNGVLITNKGGKIKFVATDGRRLAVAETESHSGKENEIEVIVPIKAVQELQRLLTWEGKVKIIPSQNQAIFKIGETQLVSRLIEGAFPNYDQVIPKEEKTKATINRQEFLQAVKRTALLTSADAPAVKMDFVKGKVIVSSRSPNLGEAKEEVAAENKGKEIAIGFNPHYLMDALKNLEIDDISFSLTDADKPGLLTGKEGYLYVVMPMQIT